MADHKSNALPVNPFSPEVKNQHTPGTWTVGELSDEVFSRTPSGIIPVFARPEDTPQHEITDEEWLANARIGAAAHDLLRQRDELLAALQDVMQSNRLHEGLTAQQFSQVWARQLTAIRRATEGQ